jgi:hypothetical protein
MKTLEQTYGADKAKAIQEAADAGHIKINKATVSIAAEKAKTDDDVKIDYPRVDILDEAGALALYGAQDAVWKDLTYAFDLGVRSKVRSAFMSTVVDPDKEIRKMAALGVKAGLYPTEEAGVSALKALKAAQESGQS